ncbi:MAG: hypothetical protein R2692_06600 [Microbacterium sp.]
MRSITGEAARTLLGLLGDDEHVGAELGEGVGRREARHRQTQHGDAKAAPVGVPAAQCVEVAGLLAHTAASHST